MSEYVKMIKKSDEILSLRLPLKGSIDITYRCNNRCLHCWSLTHENSLVLKNELTLAEIERIAGEARAMGCRYWYISGGEPLLRPDFPEIFECLTRKAIGYTLNTNGTLITPDIARLLTRKGTKMVALYGATAEVYDHVTRHPGGFEKLMQGMNYLKEAGAGFIVQLIPMQANYHQWEEMISLANRFSPHWRLGAPWLYLSSNGSPIRNKEIEAQRLDPYQVIKLDKPTPTYSERMAELNSEIEQVADHKNDDGFNSAPVLESSCRILDEGDDRLFARCIEGRREFHIDAYGKMTWCSYIKDPALRFDLRKGSFGEAWERFIPSCSDKVRGGEEWRENCGSCNKHDDCRWCAAYAYLETGRNGAPVPYLCAVAEEAKRFKEQWKKNHHRYFQVAGITVRLESDIDFSNISFKDQLETFAVEGPGNDNITLSHCFELPEFKQGALGQELYHKEIFRFSRKNGTWFYRRYLSEENSEEKLCQLAVFDSDHRHGTFYSSPEIREEIFKSGWQSLSLFPTDQIWILPLLTDRDAVLLHSAAVIVRGKGFLFAGQSEAGKSTAVELLKTAGCERGLDVEILSDEHNIIRHWQDGWRVHGTWRNSTISDVSASDAPLQGIFFLEQAGENEILSLIDRRLIWRRLLASLIRIADTDEWWQKKLDILERVVKEVPCYKMRFDKSGGIAKVLEQMFL